MAVGIGVLAAVSVLAACTGAKSPAGTGVNGAGKGPGPSLLHISGVPSVSVPAAGGISSSQSSSGVGLTSSPASPDGTDLVAGLVFPTGAYHPSVAVQDVVAQAVTQLTTQCMARFGFTYDLPAAPSGDLTGSDLKRATFGIADLSEAQQYGYHLPPEPGASGNPATGQQRAKAMRNELRQPNFDLMLTGTASIDSKQKPGEHFDGKAIPAGGCGGQAQRAIYPGGQYPAQTDSDVSGAAYTQSGDDPRVSAAITTWQACMAGNGYHIERDGKTLAPLAAGNQFNLDGPVTQAEINEAVTDVKCKKSTNLVGTWFSVESAYENAGIQQNIQQLKAEQDQWAAAAKRAVDALGVPVPQ